MIFKKYEKSDTSVNIENTDENDPYTSIGSKAFLSCKNVYEIKMPDTICEIGDWAFAHMKELKKISIPAGGIIIGREIFLDCPNLEEIIVCHDEPDNNGKSYLLASCITVLNSYELLDFELSADNSNKWYEKYDSSILEFINRPDDNNFRFVLVGWFDDESEEEQYKRHIEKVQYDKIKLCFLRLKYDICCSNDTKNELVSYIRNQFDNAEGGSRAWEIFRDELSEDIQNVKTAVNNSLINEELKSDLIKSINLRNGNPEIVAYLLSLEEEKISMDQLFEL